MGWLTPLLKAEVKKLFEPRYGRSLSDVEVIEIANNLVVFVEVYAKCKYGGDTKQI